jgi:2-phosphoglycerate kinase
MDNHKVPNLNHVRWVGGGTGAGKTTVTRLLAGQFGIDFYSTDAAIGVHDQRLEPSKAPHCSNSSAVGLWMRDRSNMIGSAEGLIVGVN